MAKWHRSLSGGWYPEARPVLSAPQSAGHYHSDICPVELRLLVPANLAGTNFGMANDNLKSTDSDTS